VQTVSRIAPTPSGYLHIGNAANFLMTWLAVRLQNGRLLLRIDDLDKARCRESYVDDVFASLEWLGIDIDEGPSGTGDFFARHSQTLRYDAYRDALERMRRNGAPLFACGCSRKTLAGAERYPGTCRDAALELIPSQTALRIAVPDNTAVAVGGGNVRLDRVLGDFVLWRKDDIPAYQLVSAVEDERAGVNLLVRGSDLYESSAAQLYLAPYLGAARFSDAAFIHHGLVLRPDGSKFSKSDRDFSLRGMRAAMGERAAITAVFDAVQRLLGLPPLPLQHPEALLDRCRTAAPENGDGLLRRLLNANPGKKAQ